MTNSPRLAKKSCEASSEKEAKFHKPPQVSERFQKASQEFLEAGSQPLSLELLHNSDSLMVGDDPYVGHEIEALRALGHEVVGRSLTYRNVDTVKEIGGDFAFNLCDGTGLDTNLGLEVVRFLEEKPLPFAGVGSAPLALTTDKLAMKKALQAANVPVPNGCSIGHSEMELPACLSYPLFVKPRFGLASEGISEKSEVHSPEECLTVCSQIISQTGVDALVEEYIEGREISVGVIGNGAKAVVLPPLEVQFGEAYRNIPKVRHYDTKNNPDSPLYWDFHTVCPAPLPRALLQNLELVALQAYRAVGADGYGRVDIRLDDDGHPFVLEVNGGCCLDDAPHEADCGIFALMARAVGWSYPETLARIIGAGRLRPIRRYRPPRAAMSCEEQKIFVRAAGHSPKGALLTKVGPLSQAPAGCAIRCLKSKEGDFLFPEPMVRYLEPSDQPNVAVRSVRKELWLVAQRALEAREPLTLDFEAAISYEAGSSSQMPAELPVRTSRRALRRLS